MNNMTTMDFVSRPIIWSIAGSDCSGGAGIQADIKTGQALGCELCTLITANTVQNAYELKAINPTAVEVLQQQVNCLLEDKPPKVIKVGLLASNAQIEWLIEAIKKVKSQQPNCQVVYDPVLKASVGAELTTEKIDNTLLQELVNNVDIITPNYIEAQALLQTSDQLPDDLLLQNLKKLGIKQVILTGGHHGHKEHVTDQCRDEFSTYRLDSMRRPTFYSHGSGCTFATALASFLAQDYLLRDAFMHAKAFMNKAFYLSQQHEFENQSHTPKSYYGALIQASWPVESNFYPYVKMTKALESLDKNGFKSCNAEYLGLYPVVDSLSWLQQLLPLGLEIIQLRLKNKTREELELLIAKAVEMAAPFKTRLFINDYWVLAIKYKAYGVHLGQEDLAIADLKAIQQAGLRLGISTHGAYEFKLAEQLKPSYLAIGAIFETTTKDMTGQIQGINNLQHIQQIKTSHIPVVAIGGINLNNADSVLKTGVQSIAVVTAITKATDVESTVKQWQALFN